MPWVQLQKRWRALEDGILGNVMQWLNGAFVEHGAETNLQGMASRRQSQSGEGRNVIIKKSEYRNLNRQALGGPVCIGDKPRG